MCMSLRPTVTEDDVRAWDIKFIQLYKKNEITITYNYVLDGLSIKQNELSLHLQDVLFQKCKQLNINLPLFISSGTVGEKLDLNMLRILYSIVPKHLSHNSYSKSVPFNSQNQPGLHSMETLFTDIQQELLVFGYCRKESSLNVAFVLKKLCLGFYKNNIFTWEVKKKDIQEVVQYNGVTAWSDKFRINNISMVCRLSATHDGYCVFAVNIDTDDAYSKTISEITVHFQVYCVESKIFYKDTAILNPDRRSASNFAMWNNYRMKLSDYINAKSLTFLSCVEMLDIKYNKYTQNKGGIHVFCKPAINIPITIEYEWSLNSKSLYDIKSEFMVCDDTFPYVYGISDYFGENCFLLAYESNINLSDQPGFSLIIKVCKLPQYVQRIVISGKYWIVHDGIIENVSCNWKYQLSYAKNALVFKRVVCYDSRWDVTNLELAFHVEFDIIEVYDLEGNKIMKQKWKEYGVSSRS
eukprot:345087_1